MPDPAFLPSVKAQTSTPKVGASSSRPLLSMLVDLIPLEMAEEASRRMRSEDPELVAVFEAEYSEFTQECIDEGIEPLPWIEWVRSLLCREWLKAQGLLD